MLVDLLKKLLNSNTNASNFKVTMARGSRNVSLLGMLGLLLENGRRAEVMNSHLFKIHFIFYVFIRCHTFNQP